MNEQISFSEYEDLAIDYKTKIREFLNTMDRIIPWEEITELIKPYYYDNTVGRPSREIEEMLRMYFLQNWYNLSDSAVEDRIYDSRAMWDFMHYNYTDKVPDATTLCKFRNNIMEKNRLGKKIFRKVREMLDANGLIMHGGSIIDATIIDAPKSTKNSENSRDPEMHQTKKGNQWYYGAKVHTGVDGGSGLVHTIEVTSANVHDSTVAPKLIRPDDTSLYGDSAYCAIARNEEIMKRPNFEKMQFHLNERKPYRKNKWKEGAGTYWLRKIEAQKSAVRWKVEYPFHILKDIFHFRKTPYRGLMKLENKVNVLMTLVNLYMVAASTKNAGKTGSRTLLQTM